MDPEGLRREAGGKPALPPQLLAASDDQSKSLETLSGKADRSHRPDPQAQRSAFDTITSTGRVAGPVACSLRAGVADPRARTASGRRSRPFSGLKTNEFQYFVSKPTRAYAHLCLSRALGDGGMREETMPSGNATIRVTAVCADTNVCGDIFGGWLIAQMDLAASVVASRHSGRAPGPSRWTA